jgi:hypothetical protein
MLACAVSPDDVRPHRTLKLLSREGVASLFRDREHRLSRDQAAFLNGCENLLAKSAVHLCVSQELERLALIRHSTRSSEDAHAGRVFHNLKFIATDGKRPIARRRRGALVERSDYRRKANVRSWRNSEPSSDMLIE